MKRLYLPCILLILAITVAHSQKKPKAPKSKPSIALGDSLFQIQQWNEAISVYEKTLRKEEGTALAWNKLGFSYHNINELDKAISAYKKSLTMKPAPPLEAVVNSRMARIYASRSQIEEAFEALGKATKAGYRNLGEVDTSEDYNSLRNDNRFKEYRERVFNTVYPCEANELARQFDFWIGEWDAYVRGTERLAGHSRIDKASGGCMILENWTSTGGPFEGKSMNFVDPESGKWKQVWVGSGASPNVSEFLNGEYRDGAMRFDFDSKDAQGNKILVQFHFYNESPDQVRQRHQTSSDGGKTWNTTYDFTYKRKK